MPLFSIVIPTRNRARLLRCTLQSTLEQTFDDYEIVVSDNFSSDGTPEVVQEFDDRRVRYFRTDEALSPLDSWDFALNKARGKWVTFLNDKSVFNPRLLEILKTIINGEKKVVGWCWCFYYSDTYSNPKERNQLMIYPYTSKITDINARSQLNKLFALEYWDRNQLFLVNACYSRDVIDEVKRRCGQFWFSPIGDLSSDAATLSVIKKYTYLDLPLTLLGASRTGTTASFNLRNEHFWNFVRESQKDGLYRHVPLQALVGTNFYCESLLRAKNDMAEFPSAVQLDWKRYFVQCYANLLNLERQGIDVAAEKKQFFAELCKRTLNFQIGVRYDILSNIIQRKAQSVIDKSSVLKYFKSLVRPPQAGPMVVRGADDGFSNILEASYYLQRLLAKDCSELIEKEDMR